MSQQDYCKTNQPISSELGFTNGKNRLTCGGDLVPIRIPDQSFRLPKPLENRAF